MSQNISTELVRVNIDEIRSNFMKPEFWEKTWNIFRYRNVFYTMRISKIDVGKRRIEMVVHSSASDGRFVDFDSSFEVPYDHPEYTQLFFSRDIERTVLESIRKEARDKLWNSDTGNRIWEEKERINRMVKKEAEEFLDKMDVTKEKIRKLYISAVVDDYWGDHKDPYFEYVSQNQYRIMQNVYILAMTWFDDKDFMDKWMKANLSGKKVNNMALKIWKMKKELSDEEFINNLLARNSEEILED